MKKVIAFVHRHQVALLGFVVVAVLGGPLLWNAVWPRRDARVEAIRRTGYPTTLMELDKWYASGLADSNAAMAYTGLLNELVLLGPDGNQILSRTEDWMPAPGERLDDQTRAEIESILKRNQGVLKSLHAVDLPGPSRYPVDFGLAFNMLLPHLNMVKRGVTVLCAEAIYRCASNEVGAVDSIAAAQRLADSLAQEPIFISQLVRVGNWAMITRTIERMLGSTQVSLPTLEALERIMRDAEDPNALKRGLAGERVFGLSIFDDQRTRGLLFSNGNNQQSSSDALKSGAFITMTKATGIFRRDRNFYLDTMSNYLWVANQEYPERLKLAQRNATNRPARLFIVSNMVLPALARAFDRHAEQVARVRCVRVALAVEKYRRAHGEQIPDTLARLPETTWSAVPMDPFDGNPLHFKKLANSYVVYSVGPDLKDDGGAEPPRKQSFGGNSARDICVVIGKR